MNDYLNHKWRNYINEITNKKAFNKKAFKQKLLLEVEEKPVETESGEDLTFRLPQFRLSDNWGKPGHGDRIILEKLFQNLRGGSFKERIENINKFLRYCNESCRSKKSATEIISTLMFLDVLHALAYDFNQSVSGYLFEPFLALFYGGTSRQVPTSGPGSGGIEDIIDDKGQKVSLKFYDHGKIADPQGEEKTTGSDEIGGSLFDLIRSISRGKPMKYLLVLKEKQGGDIVNQILFYEFTVGTIGGIRRTRRKGTGGEETVVSKHVKGTFMVGRHGDYETTGLPSDDPSIDNPDPRKDVYKIVKGKKKKVGTKVMGHFIRANDFYITIPTIKQEMGKPSAILDFGDEGFIPEVANNYVMQLQDEVKTIFNELSSLSDNLMLYFAGGQGKTAAIGRALENANQLQTGTDLVHRKATTGK